ncbi:MAG: arginine--tRNA ligase [Syntrophomonadaceae bacterium]|nr:arginine--tRNA ligase [Syntrophomonadaceae bacterium]
MSVLIRIRKNLEARLCEAAAKAQQAGRLTFDSLPSFILEVPREKQHGELATNLAMVLARPARMAPRKIAEILIEFFDPADTWVERMEIAGPGFINFFFGSGWLYLVPPEVAAQGERYGYQPPGQREKVQVEFVSANPTGLLHIGHARGAALGDTLANLLTAAGYQVTREFYINDAGNQIEKLGESLEARYLQALGQPVVFPEDGYHGEDLMVTVQNFRQQHGNAYANDVSLTRREQLVQFALEEKLAAIRETLKHFGVEFEVWFSEQTLHNSGQVQQTLEELQHREYLYEKDGAWWFRSTDFGEEKDEVLVRRNGLPTYYAADIAYHRNKFARGFERVINLWGADHHGHIARMKGALAALGQDPERLEVILIQMVRLFQGGEQVRMSKRTGQYVTLEELLEEVGRDAARYFFVMRAPESHLDFDLDLAKAQTNENPVYYIQYAHARICSIFRQAEEAGITLPTMEATDLERLQEPAELELLSKIAALPVEIQEAAEAREPHRLARYAHELASLFHSYYNAYRVLVEDLELRQARLILVQTVQMTLRSVLFILGINAPSRM